jgi:hypothetical protein
LSVFSSYKDIQYEKLNIILNDIVAELNNQLSKHKVGVNQITIDLRKMLDIDLTLNEQIQQKKHIVNRQIICLCLILNIITNSNKYIFI